MSIPCNMSSPYLGLGIKEVREPNFAVQSFQQTKDRIRELFDKVDLSVSSYDTAWVAMVPSPNSSLVPCYPECVNWLLDNQLHDGSWGLPHRHSLLIKDALSSTLAAVLALRRWGVGEEQVDKGLRFIELNFTSATDENQHSPFGFDIIFPGMLEYAIDLHLNLPLEHTSVDTLFNRRKLEIQRAYSEGRSAYLGYVSEGLGKSQDWEMIMKFQRRNGSIFNSPSTTAAVLRNRQNDGCHNYIRSLVAKFGNAVPTIYPIDKYARLYMVDSLEKLGIERHFEKEIRSVLDETYRDWLNGEEEIFMDVTTTAMAFRLLRLHGYVVSSDPLTRFTKEEHGFDPRGGHSKDIGVALELYKASQIIIHPVESALEKLNSWSNHLLKQKPYHGSVYSDRLDKYISQEVDDALNLLFHTSLERTVNRRSIEHYVVDSTRILKTSYRSSNISNEVFLEVAAEDFNICQSIHREEVENLERWVVEKRLDKLKFARQRSAYCFFSTAATLFSPELSDARISWAKNGVLTTVVDDFFDIGGSVEELVNLIQLVEKWDVDVGADCCSEHVEILFSALHSTISDIGDKASKRQGRDVTTHIVEIWLNLLKSMLREAEWVRDKFMPNMDEYMSNAYVSFALGPIVLPALYLVGPKLSEEAVRSSEYHNLYKLMSTCGRLLNDIQGFKRESLQGKLNAATLSMVRGEGGAVSEEDLFVELRSSIDKQRRELLRLVLEEKDSIVPRACKDLFWKMCKVVHFFYMKDDGFTSNDLIKEVKSIIYEPIALNDLVGK